MNCQRVDIHANRHPGGVGLFGQIDMLRDSHFCFNWNVGSIKNAEMLWIFQFNKFKNVVCTYANLTFTH